MDRLYFLAGFFAALFTKVVCLPYACLSLLVNALFFKKAAPPVLETYQYTALDAKESKFRLLKLLRYKHHKLECEILPQSLSEDEHVPYEALSYSPGSPELLETILLDGKEFWITDNLHSALQGLRLNDRDRYLWVDAICVNQADNDERSQQAQRIGQIYSKAERVLIWLGKATSEMASLMDALEQFRKSDPYRIPGHWPLDDGIWKTHRTGLQQLLDRPWFARTWSLQEAANAKQADIYCGAWSVLAETFTLAPGLIGEVPPSHCQAVLDVMPGSSRASSWWAQKRDLATLLRKFQATKTSDEHDKIYALLGMSTDSQDLQNITVDYQRPTHEVAHEAVTHLLQSNLSTEFTSTPIAVYEILNLMNTFETLQTTYFVPAFAQEASRETICPLLQCGNVSSESQVPEDGPRILGATNNPALFLLEESQKEGPKDQETCYSQVVKLMSDAPTTTASERQERGDGIQVLPWGNIAQHVKIAVIHDKRKAVLEAASRGCHHVVRELLRIKAGTQEAEAWESAELLDAAEQGDTMAVQAILEPDSVVVEEGARPFDGAVSTVSRKSDMKMLKMLLSAGISAPQ